MKLFQYMRILAWLVLPAVMLAQTPEIRLVQTAGGLPNPTDIQNAGDGSGRLFVALQRGDIRVIENGIVRPQPLLDLREKTRADSECGLLGLAFPPGFATKRYFYVDYTDAACRNSIVARYNVGASGVADAASEQVILTQPQPFPNHNGGQIRFGPDGFLYIGFGDGGSGGDPQGNGQKTGTWLSKILRIDTESGGSPYRVPQSNPFAANAAYKPEIWALGLRNPWRFSFDRETRDLWIGDVGQDRAEEIDFQSNLSKGGENYGWGEMEGMLCYRRGCDPSKYTLPVLEYTHTEGNVSVTGGFVYRGARWPALQGTYVYGDYGSGRIWGTRREGPLFNNRLLLDSPINISTFGEDEAGELYVAGHGAGAIYRIEGSDAPIFTARSVANAASFDLGLTPGSLAAIFVSGVAAPGVVGASFLPLPMNLGGVRVTVNGADAPLLAVANVNGQEQVNFQAPFELEGQDGASMAVIRNGVSSPTVRIPVAAVQPGVFSIDGTSAIMIHVSDNTIVTARNPLRRGEFVYFYMTGLGPVENTPRTGAPAPANPLARARTTPVITLGGVACEVNYAGLAPGLAGVYQVTIRVPSNAPAGVQDLAVTSGDARARVLKAPVEVP